MRIKTSLFIEENAWKEIRKAAIDAGQTVGDFVAVLFAKWKEGKNVHGNSANPPGRASNRTD